MSAPRRERYSNPKSPAELRTDVGWCVQCGKFFHASRKQAKKAAASAHPGDHMSAYSCPHSPDLWHYGHKPAAVIAGTRTMSDAR